jgi:hypothetical protein
MQMLGVGQAGRARLLELAPVDRKKRFEHRVDHHRQRKPRRYLRVAVDQQNADQPRAHAPQVGAAIAGKDASAREIPAQKAQRAAAERHAYGQQFAVAHLPANHAERGKHHHGDQAGEAVVTVDDIDRMRHAPDRHHGEHQRERIPLQEVVDARDVGTPHNGVEEINRHQRRQKARPQAHVGAELLGDILQQPRGEGGQGAETKDDGELAADHPLPDGECEAHGETRSHRHAADPHRRGSMKFLRPAGRMIVRQVRMQMFEAQQQPARGERD